MLKNFKLFYTPLLACLFVALIQFVLSTSFSLTRWEGGGFGMYSEINPTFSRMVWIRMENSNGDFRIRLSPTDKDLREYINELPEKEKSEWNKLIEESRNIRNFPRLMASDIYIEKIGNAFLNVNRNTRETMRRNNAKINVHLEVININLDKKEKIIKTKTMYSRATSI